MRSFKRDGKGRFARTGSSKAKSKKKAANQRKYGKRGSTLTGSQRMNRQTRTVRRIAKASAVVGVAAVVAGSFVETPTTRRMYSNTKAKRSKYDNGRVVNGVSFTSSTRAYSSYSKAVVRRNGFAA